MFALAQRGGVVPIGLIADPLQSAVTLGDLRLPYAYLPWLPHGTQRALIGRLATIAKRRGYTAYVEPSRAAGGAEPEPDPDPERPAAPA